MESCPGPEAAKRPRLMMIPLPYLGMIMPQEAFVYVIAASGSTYKKNTIAVPFSSISPGYPQGCNLLVRRHQNRRH